MVLCGEISEKSEALEGVSQGGGCDPSRQEKIC